MEPNPEVQALISDVRGLVTLPHVFLRINQLVDDPDSNSNDIAQAVSQDPSFTVRLLRVANSPLFGFSSHVDTVSKAVAVIGTSQIRNLALSMSIASSFSRLPNSLVTMENFWRHCLYCALSARVLARRAGRVDPEVMFTAGLLHDIGELVIFNRRPEQARQVLLLVEDHVDELPICEAERQVLGFDHAEVGGALAREWKLPPLLCACIAYHHDLGRSGQHAREVALVHLANHIALMAEIDSMDPADVAPCDARAWELVGLSPEVIPEVVRAVQEQMQEAEQLFMGN